jgi:hypothetical protein
MEFYIPFRNKMTYFFNHSNILIFFRQEGCLLILFLPLTDDENSSSLGIVSQRPLWVCADCRKTVEDDERRAITESSLLVSHFIAILFIETTKFASRNL